MANPVRAIVAFGPTTAKAAVQSMINENPALAAVAIPAGDAAAAMISGQTPAQSAAVQAAKSAVATPAAGKPAPSWMPWAVGGAVLGGGLLLLRKLHHHVTR